MRRIGQQEVWLLAFLLLVTSVIYVGSAGIPDLFDDVDSFYAEVAREMNARHDWLTPYANDIRYLEKPPLFYWAIAFSYAMTGVADAFTARLPTALAVIALVLVTFKIGQRLFGFRAGFAGGLALATSLGMFLFTRTVMPDALLTLCIALVFDSFLLWEDRRQNRSILWMYAFSACAVMAKGLLGIIFPAMILPVYLGLSGRSKEVLSLVSWKGALIFVVLAAPWHLLVGARNPGFFWFYFINEHVLRFLGKRYPEDYGTLPLALFWSAHLVWLFPWSIYLLRLGHSRHFRLALSQQRHGTLFLLTWALTIVIFFSLSTRLEYYTMPALPPLALLAGAQCAASWERDEKWMATSLLAIGILVGTALISIGVTAPPDIDVSTKLKDHPEISVFYFERLFDLPRESLFPLRAPLLGAGLSLILGFLILFFVERGPMRAGVLALAMSGFFVAANMALLILAPRLTSKPIADEINRRLDDQSIIVIDGVYEQGSSVAFYTRRIVRLHNGRSSNLEFGSYYPDAPALFLDDRALSELWRQTGQRIFLVTLQQKKPRLDAILPGEKFVLVQYGDKVLLSNHAPGLHAGPSIQADLAQQNGFRVNGLFPVTRGDCRDDPQVDRRFIDTGEITDYNNRECSGEGEKDHEPIAAASKFRPVDLARLRQAQPDHQRRARPHGGSGWHQRGDQQSDDLRESDRREPGL